MDGRTDRPYVIVNCKMKEREIKRRRITKWGTDVPLGPWSGAFTALDIQHTLSLIPLLCSPLRFDCKWLSVSAS